jgi:hypothetical protein
MQSFLSHPEARQCIPHIPNDFLDTFTRYNKIIILNNYVLNIYLSHSCLSHNNVKVLEHAIWCLASCATNEGDRRKIRLTGAIPLLLSLLETGLISFMRIDFVHL